jgi:hypothetical protein
MKGQVAIEFFIYFSIALLLLSVLSTTVFNKQSQIFEYRESSEVNSIGSKLSFELENAQNYGKGYERGLFMPSEISSDDYTVQVLEGFVVIEYRNQSFNIPTRYVGREFSVNPENSPFNVVNNGSVYVVPE